MASIQAPEVVAGRAFAFDDGSFEILFYEAWKLIEWAFIAQGFLVVRDMLSYSLALSGRAQQLSYTSGIRVAGNSTQLALVRP